MTSLGIEYSKEQERCRKVLEQYIAIGPAGTFGAIHIRATLKEAEIAAMSDDVVEMLKIYEKMKTIE